jgi:hypothetical protein
MMMAPPNKNSRMNVLQEEKRRAAMKRAEEQKEREQAKKDAQVKKISVIFPSEIVISMFVNCEHFFVTKPNKFTNFLV